MHLGNLQEAPDQSIEGVCYQYEDLKKLFAVQNNETVQSNYWPQHTGRHGINKSSLMKLQKPIAEVNSKPILIKRKKVDNLSNPNSVINALNYKIIQKSSKNLPTVQHRPRSANSETLQIEVIKAMSQTGELHDRARKERNNAFFSSSVNEPKVRDDLKDDLAITNHNRKTLKRSSKESMEFDLKKLKKYMLQAKSSHSRRIKKDQATEMDGQPIGISKSGPKGKKQKAKVHTSTNTDSDCSKMHKLLKSFCSCLDEEIKKKASTSLNESLLSKNETNRQIGLLQEKIDHYVKVCIPDICNNATIKNIQDKVNLMESLLLANSTEEANQMPQEINKSGPTKGFINTNFQPRDPSEDAILKYLGQKIDTYQKSYCSSFCNESVISDLQNKIDKLEKSYPIFSAQKDHPDTKSALDKPIQRIENPFCHNKVFQDNQATIRPCSRSGTSKSHFVESSKNKPKVDGRSENNEEIIHNARQVLHDAEELLCNSLTPRVRSTTEVQEACNKGNLEKYYDRYRGVFVTKHPKEEPKKNVFKKRLEPLGTIKANYPTLISDRPKTAPVRPAANVLRANVQNTDVQHPNIQHTNVQHPNVLHTNVKHDYMSEHKETIKRICKRIEKIENTSCCLRKTINALKEKTALQGADMTPADMMYGYRDYQDAFSVPILGCEETKRLQEIESRLMKYASTFEKEIETCKEALAKMQSRPSCTSSKILAEKDMNKSAVCSTTSTNIRTNAKASSSLNTSNKLMSSHKSAPPLHVPRGKRKRCVHKIIKRCSTKSINSLKINNIDRKLRKLQSKLEEYESMFLMSNEGTISTLEQKLEDLKKKHSTTASTTDILMESIKLLERSTAKNTRKEAQHLRKKLDSAKDLLLVKSQSSLTTAENLRQKLDHMQDRYSRKMPNVQTYEYTYDYEVAIEVHRDNDKTSYSSNDPPAVCCDLKGGSQVTLSTDSSKTINSSDISAEALMPLPDLYKENVFGCIHPCTLCPSRCNITS